VIVEANSTIVDVLLKSSPELEPLTEEASAIVTLKQPAEVLSTAKDDRKYGILLAAHDIVTTLGVTAAYVAIAVVSFEITVPEEQSTLLRPKDHFVVNPCVATNPPSTGKWKRRVELEISVRDEVVGNRACCATNDICLQHAVVTITEVLAM
jgi:hypothetical protein